MFVRRVASCRRSVGAACVWHDAWPIDATTLIRLVAALLVASAVGGLAVEAEARPAIEPLPNLPYFVYGLAAGVELRILFCERKIPR